MFVDSRTLRLALLKIFTQSRTPGAWRSYSEVADAWRHTGLRGSDLRDAVHEMMEGGELLSSERDGALSLTLSPVLLQSLMQPEACLRLGTLDEEITLLDALFRGSPGPDMGIRRRTADLVDQFGDD